MQIDATKDPRQEQQGSPSAVIIANPTSGSYAHHENQLKAVLKSLQQHGWKAELWLTKQAGDARTFSKQAVEQKIKFVVAAGGDGTINEVIQELVNTETALGVLPFGTVNVWARETGIPLNNPLHAHDILLHGDIRQIDLGEVNGRYFLLMAGIGLDGEVANAVEKKPAKRLGVLGYLLVATWMGLGFQGFPVTLNVGGNEVKTRALQIIIGNTRLYGGAVKFTWQALCDDGLLDICVVRKRGVIGRILVISDFLLRREKRRQWITYQTSDSVEIQTKKPVAIQIDGDPADFTTPATFKAIPGALRVVVPHGTQAPLFSQPQP